MEQGYAGIVRSPPDINYPGVSRGYREMANHLRRETTLDEEICR